ncbi:GNAT family N-acetyltransferase [Acidovorax sp. BoFeN1]|uniref:GNAT family N-acetyltransferase n=1 Tax=Acidovorax sp. BoFeN1 TaxID=1231053 RepID=UPI000E09CAF0|nr:GNAT family N-acetyltransferase [Acidovorax sp. BoFeN1]RDD92763.1 GNAT family N-acetyltransferase [Acidovorax sp. BoFeN1]
MTPRPLTVDDLPGLLDVQRACYGDEYVESAEVFTRRLASPAQCSLVLEDGGRVCAYLAAYDSLLGKVTPLHGDFEAVPQADTLYLHDMAVLPTCAGQGLAQALLKSVWDHAAAQGLRHTALVSVQGSQTYWERHGYAQQPLGDAAQRERLASYGAGAVYMARAMAVAANTPPMG